MECLRQRTRAAGGFTLTELLVVLAVIGLIAAIIVPVFLNARGKARQAICASNLRHIGMISEMYFADNNGAIFPSLDHADDRGGIMHWTGYEINGAIDPDRGPLNDYFKDTSVWLCPSSRNLRQLTGSDRKNLPTYGLNIAFARVQIETGSTVRVSQAELPAETILAADCADYWRSGAVWAEYIRLPSDHNPSAYGCHLGHANVLWRDGHVSSRKPVPAYAQGSQATIDDLRRQDLGDILRGASTGDAARDDYYYTLKKP
jgi:prepilin-type N-terminal cleavage/methylation domain-containing protein/prepilin-type processing-associated H-X9-DG protein